MDFLKYLFLLLRCWILWIFIGIDLLSRAAFFHLDFKIPQFLYWIFAFLGVIFAGYKVYKEKKIKPKLSPRELYEKQFNVYKAIENLLLNIREKSIVEMDIHQLFYKETKESSFFFDKEITDYIDKIANNVNNLMSIIFEVDNPDLKNKRQQLINEKYKLLKWFNEQLEGLQEKFKPYLKIN